MEYFSRLSFNSLITLSSLAVFGSVVLATFWVGPAWDMISSRAVAQLTPQLVALRISPRQLSVMLRVWGAGLFTTFVGLFFILHQIPLSFMLTWLVYVAPHYLLVWQVQRRRRLLRDQMVGVSVALANSVRAGLALAQGLESIVDDTPEPIASEIRTIVFEWRSGRPLNSALLDVKHRINLDSFSLFSIAIEACMERGGRITEALERISYSLSENQRLERDLEAKTATGRSTAWVLGLFPFVFLVGFLCIDYQHTSLLFTTIIGQLVLTGIIATIYGSVKWCLHILDVRL